MTLLRGLAPWLGAVLVALALQLAGPAMGPFATKLATDIAIAVVLAVSLNLVTGFTGQFSIGHAGFMLVGGYASGLVTYYGGTLIFGDALPRGGFLGAGEWLFATSCVFGGLVAAGFGWLVGLPSLRLRGDYLALVTLGFGEILRVLIECTDDVLVSPDAIRAAPLTDLPLALGGSLGFGGLPFYTNLFWAWLFAGVTVVFALRLKASTQGRAFLAVRGDEIAAEAMGVPTTALKVRAFLFAAFFAGVAGALFAHELGVMLNPKELGFQKSFEVVTMVLLGGLGSVSGSVLAAGVLTLLPEALRELSDYRMIGYALILVGMMLFRPEGLFGLREAWELGRGARRPPQRPRPGDGDVGAGGAS